MSAHEFSLRPASVQRQFPHAPVLLLSGNSLAAAAVIAETDCLAVQIDRLEVLPGVMRAAEDLDVALWLQMGSLFDPEIASRELIKLSQTIVTLATKLRLQVPLVLGVDVDISARGPGRDFASTRLAELIEAGFTAFRFAMPVDSTELVRTLQLMALVQDMGLGLELGGVPELGRQKALEIFTRSDRLLCAVQHIDRPSAQWVLDAQLVPAEQSLRICFPSERFMDMIARSLDLDREDAAMAPLDKRTRQRVEALAYADTRSVVRKLGLIGSGSSCLAALGQV